MKKQVVISFEDRLIKVVHASYEKDKTVVQRTTVFHEEEFDSFLKTAKLPDLTVVCHFKRFYSDIIAAPPAKPAYLKKIIETEIKKRFPEVNDFSYFYCVLTEKSSTEKGTKDIFFFAVSNDELFEIMERFNKYGKSVKYIYPDILALSHLIKSSENWNSKTVLSLLISETDRTLFLVKNGQICFIRVTPSLGPEVTDIDIDNINMTISYCRQKLRLHPEQIILMNAPHKGSVLNAIIPSVSVTYPVSILASDETLSNFAAPLSAIVFGQELRNDNLLPLKYSILYTQRSVASYAVILFFLFSLIGLCFILINLSEISQINEKINILRKDLTEIDSITSTYESGTERLQQFSPLINFVNDVTSYPDIQKALVSLNFLPMDNVSIHNIQINNKKDTLLIQISGIITAKNYEEMHRVFIKLYDTINNVSGMAVTLKNIDLKSGNFQIDVENKS